MSAGHLRAALSAIAELLDGVSDDPDSYTSQALDIARRALEASTRVPNPMPGRPDTCADCWSPIIACADCGAEGVWCACDESVENHRCLDEPTAKAVRSSKP